MFFDKYFSESIELLFFELLNETADKMHEPKQ